MHILYLYTDYFQNFDILWALLQAGHTPDVMETPFMTYAPDEKNISELEKRLASGTYSLVLSFGYVPYISDICEQHQTPYAAWTYDSILHSLYNDSIENTCNILFVYDHAEYLYLQEHFHIPNLYYLPLAVNTERVQGIATTPSDVDEYLCDVSFVGDLYQANTYVDLEPDLSRDEQVYFEQAFSYFHGKWNNDSIYDWFSKADADYLQNRLPDYLKNTERMPNKRYFADILLSKPIACRERIEMLNRLAKKHNVRLYHKASTDTSCLQNVECHAGVNYYDAMSKAFALSRINLNCTLHGMVSGIPLRCFDVMGAGGFLLTNYQSELPDYFVEDKELVIYRSLDELEEKVTYYLSHDSERRRIAEAGFSAIEKSHTYRHRIEKILSIAAKCCS